MLATAAAALGVGNPPVCGVRAMLALENGYKGHVEHAQGTSNLKQGSRGVGEHCKASAMAELRRRRWNYGVPRSGVIYGP